MLSGVNPHSPSFLTDRLHVAIKELYTVYCSREFSLKDAHLNVSILFSGSLSVGSTYNSVAKLG